LYLKLLTWASKNNPLAFPGVDGVMKTSPPFGPVSPMRHAVAVHLTPVATAEVDVNAVVVAVWGIVVWGIVV
jgi:hypothetical protein